MEDGAGLSSGGIATNVGKVASALLAKHVRTLEILHSLQKNNAQLKEEIQERSGEEEIRQRIAEAVAAAVAAPNDLTKELRAQGENLRERVAGLEKELASAKEASAQMLDHASSQMKDLRALNQTLEKKCKDVEFEAICQARQASLQEKLGSQLREASMALALAEERAADLTSRLADQESISCSLQLRLKENDAKIRAMKASEAALVAKTNEDKIRIADADRQGREMREKLGVVEAERRQLGLRLEQASRDIETARAENAERAAKEQELLEKVGHHEARVNAAEAKLSEERRRFQNLRDDAERKLEEGAHRYNEAQTEYGCERERLFERIDALLGEIESLRARMSSSRSQFSKYVEAKTENTQLKEELDGLREMVVVVPRPPHRSHSLGSSSSVVSSTLGGVVNKHVGVERLRHSISVARGHHTSTNSNSNGNGNGNSYGISIGSGGGKIDLVRRNSGHSSSNSGGSVGSGGGGGGGGGGSGWIGSNQSPSYKLSVAPAGFGVFGVGGGSGKGDEAGARHRAMRPAQQVF
ncbi:unnamed protein product [Pylaiella littoralis]